MRTYSIINESLVLGLTAKQFLFSALALGVGTWDCPALYEKIRDYFELLCGPTPFVVPLALTGFYNYHGLTFWQFAGKMIYFSFFNRPLVYGSTESVQELKQIYMETRQEEEREVQQRKKEQKKEKKGGDVNVVKKKAIRMGIVTVVMIVLGAAAAVWYKMYR